MQLDVPFYTNTNDGNQCMQVTMQCVLDYFLKKKYDVSELDKLTGRKPNFWTNTVQIVGVLYDLGLDVRFFSADPLEPFAKDVATVEAYVRKVAPTDAENIIKKSNFPVIIEFAKKLSKRKLFENRKLTFDDIEEHIRKGHVPLLLIDHATLEDQAVGFRGHFVAVTGFDKKTVSYHESSPVNPIPNRRVSKEVFIRAWNVPATGNDAVIVYGKREK